MDMVWINSEITSSSRVLIEGDRMGLVATGTLTALSDVHITIYYKEINQGYIR